ncbi:MAG: hypothetical protein WD897_01695 [Parcubacteria group bacterium]
MALISLRRGKLSPMEASGKLFEEIVPDERMFCFLLMVRHREWLALKVITDLRKKKGRLGKISVDEAILVMEDEEMDEHCRRLSAEILQELETKRKKRKKIVNSGNTRKNEETA